MWWPAFTGAVNRTRTRGVPHVPASAAQLAARHDVLIGHTGTMGATYEEDDWGGGLADEPNDELVDDPDESWLLDDELPLDADEPE